MSTRDSNSRAAACPIIRHDLWVISRALCGLNGEILRTSGAIQPQLDALLGRPLDQRQSYWDGFLSAHPDRAAIDAAIVAIDPNGPPPPRDEDPEGAAASCAERPANLADLAAVADSERWLREGYLRANAFAGIGAFEGVGKTRFALYICRRVWN